MRIKKGDKVVITDNGNIKQKYGKTVADVVVGKQVTVKEIIGSVFSVVEYLGIEFCGEDVDTEKTKKLQSNMNCGVPLNTVEEKLEDIYIAINDITREIDKSLETKNKALFLQSSFELKDALYRRFVIENGGEAITGLRTVDRRVNG